jgi:hypothetical protein
MPRTKAPENKLPPPFKVDEYVRITDDAIAGHVDQVTRVLEVSEEDGTVRTEWGWYMPTQVEPAAAPELETTVDGKPALVVLNGKSGGVQEPLVHQSLEQIAANIAKKYAELDIARSEAGRARKYCNTLEKKLETMVRELCAASGNEVPLPFDDTETDNEGDE